MKFFLFFCSIFISFNVFAFDNIYNVTGVIESGGIVEGSARNNVDEDDNVYGQITDEEGDIHSYNGKWIDNGLISGETDDGESVELHTKL